MSEADFVCDYLHLVPSDSEQEVISVYARAADTTGDRCVYVERLITSTSPGPIAHVVVSYTA